MKSNIEMRNPRGSGASGDNAALYVDYHNNICGICLWRDICEFEPPCDDFSSLDDSLDDACIDEIIEQRKYEYRQEWEEYISEFE